MIDELVCTSHLILLRHLLESHHDTSKANHQSVECDATKYISQKARYPHAKEP
jgi:hypothetical protein